MRDLNTISGELAAAREKSTQLRKKIATTREQVDMLVKERAKARIEVRKLWKERQEAAKRAKAEKKKNHVAVKKEKTVKASKGTVKPPVGNSTPTKAVPESTEETESLGDDVNELDDTDSAK